MNESIKRIKESEASGLTERIDMNSGSVQIIEQKLDQLIGSLRIPMQRNNQHAPVQVQHVQPQHVTNSVTRDVTNRNYDVTNSVTRDVQPQQIPIHPEEEMKQHELEQQLLREHEMEQQRRQQNRHQEQEHFEIHEVSEEGECFPPVQEVSESSGEDEAIIFEKPKKRRKKREIVI